MIADRFYGQVEDLVHSGHELVALPLVAGALYTSFRNEKVWPRQREAFAQHPLCDLLRKDPFSARAALRPRGYAGDAELLDIIYSKKLPEGACDIGRSLFNVTIEFQAPEAVRQRRDYAEQELLRAHAAGKRILALACGHFREAGPLIGEDMSNVTVVDQDPLSLELVRANHDPSLTIIEANVIRFLRDAASRGDHWDYVYTLGLTDYFDTRAMDLFHQLLARVVQQDGSALVANFVPDHLGIGWMEAVMDWQLIYRDEADLAAHAERAGFIPHTWMDPTGSIAFCEMLKRSV